MKLTRFLTAAIVFLLSTGISLAPLAAQEGNQLDGDIRLFTVLTALNLAGYDQGLGSPSDSPVRQAIREDLKDFDGSSLTLLKNFYEQFKQDDPGENLSQYISFALIAGPPPDFEIRAELPTDLPPDVRQIRTFSGILSEFYHQAEIEKLWGKYQPQIEQEILRYSEPLINALFEAGGYLRVSPSSPMRGGRFQVYFDLLGAPNAVNTRSYGGNMFVVVHPSSEPRIDEIRHAFLLYQLDGLSIRYGREVAKKEVLSRFALFAPALDEAYKTDFQLLVTKSLVKAVEARLARMPEAKRLDQVGNDLRDGFILTPYFYEALGVYEKQGQEMRRYYPEMIEAIDLKKEAARLQSIKFNQAPVRERQAPARPKISETDGLLREGEMYLQQNKLSEAREKFGAALAKSGGLNAEASYGLARVAIADADPDLALNLFAQTLRSRPDPHLEAMSHVYMGRVEDIMGNRDEAVEHYRQALAAGDPSERTRQLAQKGLDEPFGRPGEEEPAAPEESPKQP